MNRFLFIPLHFLLLSLSISFFVAAPAFSDVLPPDEVEILRVIGQTLGTSWNFSVDPCSGTDGWVSNNPLIPGFNNTLSCNCTFNESTVCHVSDISLNAQNLSGTLPPQIANLPYLQQIDLTRNYLSGAIPSEWGNSTSLVDISLLGNRLTGSVPKELGKILTLRSLVLEINQLSGTLPQELGSLSLLERLFLTSNYFTGELPGTFVGLTSLKDIRLGDNQFTGQIPNFIQNWTNLEMMVLQASGLTGPIPSGISLLSKVTDLRISDLTGSAAPFPPISNMTNLKTLILKSCNITGVLPDYLNMGGTLKMLDLSFNMLQGPISSSYDALREVDNVILTGNMLNGSVPDWMLEESRDSFFDISYNNFSNNISSSCQQKNVNVFAATAKGNSSGIVSCLGKKRCAETSYSMRINCGGNETTIINGTKKIIFGEDPSDFKSSGFVQSRYNWGISNTGVFMNADHQAKNYIWANSSALSVTTNHELYTTARLSALSLTYYGYCLGNGAYTVNLHFAEIMFTNDKTFSKLGRRIFDVYIQGKLVLENFDIVREAGGVGMAVVKSFPVNITDGTFEIRFYWAGKGTNAIPVRGVYGPLISAISVDPDFEPPEEDSMSTGVVVGIVAAMLVMIFLILGILWWKGCYVHWYIVNFVTYTMNEDLRGLDLKTGSFTLRQIRAATNNFDLACKIGEGGFGPVYKGLLADGTIIAVKRLSSKSKQGNREFINEIGMISALQHPNLVKLYGCCIEGNQLLLIYEYLENNSLARALFGPEEHQLKLDWRTRYNICIGIARGLAYLHEESRLKIVHRDIKATNVLLDKNLEPKISDFGLAKLDEEGNTHISTRVAGTFGYMAPEYALRGYLTDKADVYSFGIVVLEIVNGRSNTNYRPKEECFYLLDWALILKEKSSLLDLVDERLGSDFDKKEAMVMINLGLQCTNVTPAVRPLMSNVVSMLEGRVLPKETVSDPNAAKKAVNAMWNQYQREKENRTNDGQNQSISLDAPWASSSASAVDLYPINLDSAYLNNRDWE